ncbi:hypothetical protein BH11MYX1_BH11MYX1_31480 [soil metagenome]
MRTLLLAFLLAACPSSPDPRMITGGGVGDGAIDGTVNVYVIDTETYAPIADATVEVAGKDQQTDSTGLAVFSDVNGPQTLAIKAAGYRGAIWQGANGANLTIPVTKLGTIAAQHATLSGEVANWSAVTVAPGHLKVAVVSYSQTDSFGDPENNLKTPSNGNVCVGALATCSFSVVARTGAVTLTAAIVDVDTHGTADASDDTLSVIGWAKSPSVQVDAGIDQTGLTLTQLAANQLQTVTIAYATPPSALTKHDAVVGIELSKDEIVQLPVLPSGATMALMPVPTAFVSGATYRLSALARTPAGDAGDQSVTIQRGQTSTALAAERWLEAPTGLAATRTSASVNVVAMAKLHTITWSDPNGKVLDATLFDAKQLTVTVPSLLALPQTGTLTATAQGIGADFDLGNFSLDTDTRLVWGASNAAATIN